MTTDFALWLMQQPAETKLLFYAVASIILVLCSFYYAVKEE